MTPGTLDTLTTAAPGLKVTLTPVKGATVQFSVNELPPIIPGLAINHATPYLVGTPESVGYMIDRFNNVPAPSNC